MITEGKDDPAREAIIEQASEWFLRHRAGDLSEAEKEVFLDWLRDSKLNMQEYLEQVRLHQALVRTVPDLHLDREQLLEQIAAESSGNVATFTSGQNATAPHRGRASLTSTRWRLSAAAATLLLVGGIVWLSAFWFGTQRINVPHGEQRTIQLADGSTVHINVSSRVRVNYTRHERLIEIDEGQALFEVARDPTRPFRVRAGDTEVVAVGTQFDVYRRAEENVIVTVLEGRVDVIKPAVKGRSAVAEVDRRMRVTAGEQVELRHNVAPAVPRVADVRAASAWTRRQLIFKGETLEQVAAELNRYIAVPIHIHDEALRKMPVRAVFNAYDSESFLAFLRQYGVEVESTPTSIDVMRQNN